MDGSPPGRGYTMLVAATPTKPIIKTKKSSPFTALPVVGPWEGSANPHSQQQIATM